MQYGHQADWVLSKPLTNGHARRWILRISPSNPTYARDHSFERSAVQDERAILRSAMDRSMGQASASQVRAEFDRRSALGEFQTVTGAPGAAAGPRP